MKRVHLHFYQDLATPHNNDLLRALRARGDVSVTAWYHRRVNPKLPWDKALDDHPDARFLDSWSSRLGFLAALFSPRPSQFLFTGYATLWPRLGILVHTLLRRDFGYWTDNPPGDPIPLHRRLLRALALTILRRRARPTLVVGSHTRASFLEQGFRPEVVHDLPICVGPPNRAALEPSSSIRARLGVPEGRVLVVAASRLTKKKGYDVLIAAWGRLAPSARSQAYLVIVGDGPERPALESAIAAGNLRDVRLVPWQEPRDYWGTLAAADVFVHPARFDAFGGGTLYSMAFGIPVVGSTGAGVVRERVVDGVNGLVVPPEEPDALATAIGRLITDPDLRARMGASAKAVAAAWEPDTGAEILATAMRGRVAKRFDLRAGIRHGDSAYRVRPMEPRDVETLRVWKNAHRQFFFHTDIIEPDQQQRWFEQFSRMPDRQIVVLERDGVLMGCVGYRELDFRRVELFNLLRNMDERGGDGLIGAFFASTEALLRSRGVRQIELDVVTHNLKAIRWYERQGFTRIDTKPASVRLVKPLPGNPERPT